MRSRLPAVHPGKGVIDADKDNDIDTSSHAIPSAGAQPRGGHHERGTVTLESRQTKQAKSKRRQRRRESKREAQEDDENLTAFFVKTFACLQI